MPDDRQDLYALTRPALHELIASWGISRAHGKAVWKAIYLGQAESFRQIPGIPLRLHERLEAGARIGSLCAAAQADSSDGFTRKFLLSLCDGERIEAVLMRFTGRVTACVSSQAGCAMGCVFCATGQMGYRRQLTAAEIVAQVMHVARALSASDRPGRLRNVVFMGMGEPLLNYEAVMQAVGLLMDPHGLGIGGAHITISTVGVVPGILRMADEACPACLAVSLHAPTQDERLALVPVARKWPLAELMEACRYYCGKLGRRIFFELALIDGRNDSEDHAHAVGRLLQGIDAQVNLIPLNPTAGYAGAPSRSEAAKKFQSVLSAGYGLPSTVRQRRGIDIAAGCGQLAAAK